MLKYEVVTDRCLWDIDFESGEDKELFAKEQDEKATEVGLDIYNQDYKVHFFESRWMYELTLDKTINEAVQILAIKDGCDFVRFENGNYGFVGYYNGNENGFEILGLSMEE